MNNFPCTSCGQCCRMVGKMLLFKNATSPGQPYYREMQEFPYQTDARGVCEKLNNQGQCSVYDNRPDLCNIETIRKRYFADLTEPEYFAISAANCNNMIEGAGLDKSFIVKI